MMVPVVARLAISSARVVSAWHSYSTGQNRPPQKMCSNPAELDHLTAHFPVFKRQNINHILLSLKLHLNLFNISKKTKSEIDCGIIPSH